MILSGNKIKSEIKKDNININPFDEKLINPNSYNYHLGDVLYEMTDKVIDPKIKSNYKKIQLTNDGYVLNPHKLYLASTKEKIGSKKYITQLIGKSSVGRLGLFVQITAPYGHYGCYHNWTLELKSVIPIKVYKNMIIGQIMFLKTIGKKYYTDTNGKYNKHDKPYISQIYKENI